MCGRDVPLALWVWSLFIKAAVMSNRSGEALALINAAGQDGCIIDLLICPFLILAQVEKTEEDGECLFLNFM